MENTKMKRRDFALACSAAFVPAVWAQQGGAPRSGQAYLSLPKPAPVEAPADRVEVVEFFWYNCPHCHAFEPALDAWLRRQPKHVAFRRVPVAFNADFEPQQRLYYTLEAMGLVDKLHAKVFGAIHGEGKRLERPEIIADWVAAQGVDKGRFGEIFNSFSVASKVTRARQLTAAYSVEGVPAMGVAGASIPTAPWPRAWSGCCRQWITWSARSARGVRPAATFPSAPALCRPWA